MANIIAGSGGRPRTTVNVTVAGRNTTPVVDGDSLDSRQYATIVDFVSEGEIYGLVDGYNPST